MKNNIIQWCKKCKGTGFLYKYEEFDDGPDGGRAFYDSEECYKCNGKGWANYDKNIFVSFLTNKLNKFFSNNKKECLNNINFLYASLFKFKMNYVPLESNYNDDIPKLSSKLAIKFYKQLFKLFNIKGIKKDSYSRSELDENIYYDKGIILIETVQQVLGEIKFDYDKNIFKNQLAKERNNDKIIELKTDIDDLKREISKKEKQLCKIK